MEAVLARRVDELVECGWEPQTTTETTASLVGRRPFSWWLFLFVVIFFPLFGGILYLIFVQEARREATIGEQRQIKERGFLAVMWPKLLVFLPLLFLWVWFLRWYY